MGGGLAGGVDVSVLAFGTDKATRTLANHLRDAGIFVFVMVGTEAAARHTIGYRVDGLIAQGREAGGHPVGAETALDFLPRVLALSGKTPQIARSRRHCSA